MNRLQDKLRLVLSTEFDPEHLEIIDDTEKHKKHLNTPHNEETHFTIIIVSKIFQPMSRIERHRCIFGLFEEDFKNQLHALSIKAFTQDEYQRFVKIKSASSKIPLQI
ncbi:MAG: BolA family transcriptional regulator [Holosporales bacterium]|nr:BolA family transcriptional regulator [Holosporales bacterium]